MTSSSSIAMIAALPDQRQSFLRARRKVLLATMFCYLFFYTGRQTFGFAIPGIQAEFGVSKETLGWVSAALLWCYAIGQAINGNLGDKLGGRTVMSAGAILSCATNWAVSFSTGLLSLGFLWGLNGYFQAMGWAPGSRVLSNWFGPGDRGKVFGCYVFAAGMASVLSFVTSILVVHIFEMEWRWIFRIPVLLMLLGGLTFFFVARERPEDLGFGSPHASEREAVSETSEESSMQRYRAVLSNWRIWMGGLAIGFQNAARYGLLVWVPVHFIGGDGAAAAGTGSLIAPEWTTIALPVGMAIGAATNGYISDRYFATRRYVAIVLYMTLATAMALLMYSIPAASVQLGLAVLFLCGFFVYGPQASFWALCPDLVGHRRAGTAVGVMNFFAYLFAGLGEPLIGKVMDSSGTTSVIFLLVAMASGASAVTASFIRR
ncbi:2-phosphonopropionate transporter [Sphingobium sp. SYK-6]|uniref:MFS transporter n=1 Tax=Sphingobium sp. (strain NBRC 103272 / SYK-6) TaxID=627192 RepID=UPI000227711A|nr:MFS transporter [Sphingobium sp. SYK-6]BAK66377.1 2-phosphonopropionate transporter [Sphingobium sp. SYK-6]